MRRVHLPDALCYVLRRGSLIVFKILHFFAEDEAMDMSTIMSTISAVLLNPAVIFISIAVILYLNFVNFVVRYRKKPPKTKKKAVVAPAPAPAAEGEGQEEE